MRYFIVCIVVLCVLLEVQAQQIGNHQAPGVGNPLIPGYFADPTVKKFGDTYYIYATTDGNGGGFGPSQVWVSKDFVNWTMQPMNWPTTPHFWAPDVTQGNDGKYYMYYCQPTVEIYGASGKTPVGPWTPLYEDEKPIVKNYQVTDVITLDGQTFRDDDGKFYMFWGTWGIYPNSGCGIGLLNDDMKSFSKMIKLPNTIAKDFFEAPFMFKRNGIYYLLYSSGRCEDHTYRVQYVFSKTGPMGPFEYGKTNPILVTNTDGTVHGPGHQSVIEHKESYYLVYHRHNNPHSNGGYHRQVCADKMVFDAEGNIEKIVPTHTGIGPLGPLEETAPNLAFAKSVTASSYYDADFKPEFAVDDNNGTLWKPRDNTSDTWLQIDLGSIQPVKRIHTQFEYATWYYQYLWEYSLDGKQWTVYIDQRKNTKVGSPMVDVGNVKARYLRLTITDTQYPGLNKAVWNIKVYSTDRQVVAPGQQPVMAAHQPVTRKGLLLDLSVDSLPLGKLVHEWSNTGNLEGTIHVASTRIPHVDLIAGRKALIFSGREYFQSSVNALPSLAGNSPWTVAMWIYNPEIGEEEPVVCWTPRGGRDLSNVSIGYGRNRNWGAVAHWGWPDLPYKSLPEATQWHHIAITFDGTMERIYVDGKQDQEDRRMLFVQSDQPLVIGANGDKTAFFSGALSSLKVYDKPLSKDEVIALSQQENESHVLVSLMATKLVYGSTSKIVNEGYGASEFIVNKGSVVVKDLNEKIAIVIPPGISLDWKGQAVSRLQKSYSTIMVAMSGKGWIQQIEVHQNQTIKKYINGVLTKTQPISGSENSLSGISLSNLNLTSYQIYDYPFAEGEIKTFFTEWKNSSVKLAKPFFQLKPKAISPQMVQMSAGNTAPGVQYWFEETGTKKASGWLDDPVYMVYGLQPNQKYNYTVKVRDAFGNVSLASDPVSVNTMTNQFIIKQDVFETEKDFLKEGVNTTIWDGYIGKNLDETALAITSKADHLHLESSDSRWDETTPKGPFLYKNVTGDFVVQVEIVDVSGLKEKKANGANDVGLMVRLPQEDRKTGESLIQSSIFPGWGVGNMVTNLSVKGREQTNNQSAWEFDQYLQIQRMGDSFYLRSSKDGILWKDLPGSPIQRPDWTGKSVQVGLYQATYGKRQGYGEFQKFELIIPVKISR
ncbi:family 43 glycosylhydrolase [Xanthocytophaga agilis]|uniref:Family 43 glycosylhydrolase n=1 Tax=Xanthocytophaga agilis TaxID=3048010 RepID=A0AAE3R4J0_9BACT|nr:family 43 glycosylhydrolase [Xanthocytophaga agilis]MDJ1503771.1 family 43 glycosylhydrolase [Xanthocytophaga agilis]